MPREPIARKTCSRADCCRPVKARGLCNSHYEQWHRKLPAKLGISNSNAEILTALPATILDIASATGIKYETVRKAMKKLHAAGEVHIEDFRLPIEGASGSRHSAIFTRGPGVDAKLSKKEAHAHSLAARRAWYAAKESRPRRADPLVAALFGRMGA